MDLEGLRTLVYLIYAFIGIILLVIIISYFGISVSINKTYKKIYGKETILAWIPIAKEYIIGKLAYNRLTGILYSFLLLLGIYVVFINPGDNPDMIKNLGLLLLVIPSGIFYLMAITKMNKIRDGFLNPIEVKKEIDSFGIIPKKPITPPSENQQTRNEGDQNV